jgi:hypothetical protein
MTTSPQGITDDERPPLTDEELEAHRRHWALSQDRRTVEAEARQRWPENLDMGRWDGVTISAERALLAQREAFAMGAQFQDRSRHAEVDRLRAELAAERDRHVALADQAATSVESAWKERDEARAELAALPDLDTIRRIEKERGSWGLQLSEERRENAALVAKVEAVRKLHPKTEYMDSWGNRTCEECSSPGYYQECPCPTAVALGETGGTER